MEAIKLARRALDVPLIGFAGAPFTLASYAIEGAGSKNYYEAKKLMYADEGAWNVLMEKISVALGQYLNAQIDAGAQVVQLFDSWVGCLSPADYRRYVFPHTKSVFDAVNIMGVDWRVDLSEQWDVLGGPEKTRIMGNLEPAMLLAPESVMKEQATRVLERAAGRPGHIFNLGHGIMPSTTVDHVRALVDHVHEVSARRKSPSSAAAFRV